MSESVEISVCVGNYNPDWKKLLKTLKSIVYQKGVRFEIIIGDDGSKNDLFPQIEEFFRQVGFRNYKLVKSQENHGTVMNGMQMKTFVHGKYIKPISAGDLFYKDDSLKRLLEFSEKNRASVVFGDAVFYNDDNGFKIIKHFHNPRITGVYNTEHVSRMLKLHYLLLSDGISGAAIFARSDIYGKYLEMIAGKVKYAEDYMIRIMILDEVRIHYYKHPIIWYEFGTGISTVASDFWKEKLREDDEACEAVVKDRLINNLKNNKNTFDWKYLKLMNSHAKGKIRLIKGEFLYPELIFAWLRNKLFGEYTPTDVDRSFYDRVSKE